MERTTDTIAVTQRPTIENPAFFDLLQVHDIIDADFIRDLLEEFDGNALDVLATLIQSGVGTKRQLCQLWCDSIGIAHVDLEKTLFQPHIVRKIPERFARHFYAIPVYQMGETITVAIATPDNKEIAGTIEQIVGGPVSMVFALPHDIETAIENEYQTHGAIHDFFIKIAAGKILKAGGPVTAERLTAIAGSEAINQLHVAMVLYGTMENATEIHLIAGADAAVIEYRNSRQAAQRIGLEKQIYKQLLDRLKTLAGVDPAANAQAGYGRIVLPTPGKKIDVRFECHPAEAGETVILKLTDPKPFKKLRSIKSLHVAHRIQQALESRLDSPEGLFLLAGPARSEKTMLAYAMLKNFKQHGKKIVTIEERIKFLLPGIDQYQVNAPAGFPATDQLASALKLRPDVIYLQDLAETKATIPAAETALSGRMVIAGIQASDALAAIASAITPESAHLICGVLVQHLVAQLCDHCKQPYTLSPKYVQTLFTADAGTKVTAWREKGCPYCNHTGFSGRIGIHELLLVNGAAGEQIKAQASLERIREAAGPENYYSLRYDGIKKVLRGLTTFDEVDRLQMVQ